MPLLEITLLLKEREKGNENSVLAEGEQLCSVGKRENCPRGAGDKTKPSLQCRRRKTTPKGLRLGGFFSSFFIGSVLDGLNLMRLGLRGVME